MKGPNKKHLNLKKLVILVQFSTFQNQICPVIGSSLCVAIYLKQIYIQSLIQEENKRFYVPTDYLSESLLDCLLLLIRKIIYYSMKRSILKICP